MRHVYLCIDLKSYYASVECVERGLDPLRTNLVVADLLRTEKTICLAVSPSLKAYGISGRPRLFEVEEKLRQIRMITGKEVPYIVATPRMQLYLDYSAKIYSIYLKYVSAEDIHVYSVDEVFMDISWYLKKYQNDPKRMATVILHDVLKTTGITATAGIGTNLYLAKVAMDIVAKKSPPDKNGVRIASLTEQVYKELLWEHQPLTDFWGIGQGISSKLTAHGMFTMGDIAQTSLAYEDIFYKMFGVNAELIIDHAWGVEPCTMEDIKRYKPSTHSLSSGHVLPCNYSYEKGQIIVKEMVDSLVLEMMDYGLATNSVTLQIGYDRHASSSAMKKDHYGFMSPKPTHGSVRFDIPTTSVSKLTDTALSIYARVVDPDIGIRKITITFANVAEDTEQQLDLFSDTKQQEKEQKVQDALFRIKKKYGKNAVLRGVSYREGATMRERNQQIGGHKA